MRWAGRTLMAVPYLIALVACGAAPQESPKPVTLVTPTSREPTLEERKASVCALAVLEPDAAKKRIAHVFTNADDEASLVEAGATYFPTQLSQARDNLEAAFKKRGYLDVSLVVSSAFADMAQSTVDVCVKLDRGPLVAIDAVKVRGSAHGAAIEAIILQRDHKNVVGHLADADELAFDEPAVYAFLHDKGLAAAEVKSTIERHDAFQTVLFDVTDGDVYRYASIDVRGTLNLPKADYMRLFSGKKGDVFVRSAVMKFAEDIKALDASHGHPDITVDPPKADIDETKHTVAVVIEVHDIASTPGFSIVELKRGTGAAAKQGDLAKVEYVGTLPNGTVFDKTMGRGPFEFRVGGNSVIKGFDRGVIGMKIGGKRRVTIPPDLAYGPRGTPPTIPPNSSLIFELELVALK